MSGAEAPWYDSQFIKKAPSYDNLVYLHNVLARENYPTLETRKLRFRVK